MARVFVLFALAGVVIPLYTFHVIEGADPGAPRGIDFRTFHESARSYRATGEVYPEARSSEVPNLNNPHTMWALYAPFGELPYDRAFVAYSAASLILLLASLPILAATVGAEGFAALAVALALLVWLPTYLSAQMGQVGFVLLLPLAFGWWAMDRGKQGWAGVGLGVALAMKLFVGLFVPVLLVARKWKAAGATLVTVSGIYLTGILAFGWRPYLKHFELLAAVDHESWNGNLSLLGVASRFGAPAGPLPLTNPLYLGLAGPVGLLVLYGALRARTPGHLFGLTVVGMLLLSPLTWWYYMPLLIVPTLAAWQAGGWVRWAAVPAWAIAGLPSGLHQLNIGTAGLLMMLGVMVGAVVTADGRHGSSAKRLPTSFRTVSIDRSCRQPPTGDADQGGVRDSHVPIG